KTLQQQRSRALTALMRVHTSASMHRRQCHAASIAVIRLPQHAASAASLWSRDPLLVLIYDLPGGLAWDGLLATDGREPVAERALLLTLAVALFRLTSSPWLLHRTTQATCASLDRARPRRDIAALRDRQSKWSKSRM